MARYKGHQGELSAGGNTVGEVESFDIEIASNELAANVMGSDWTDVEGGQKSGTGSITVIHDRANAGQAALIVGTKVAVVLYPEGNTTGLTSITGNMMILSKSISSSVGDLVKATYSVRNAGTLTETAVS